MEKDGSYKGSLIFLKKAAAEIEALNRRPTPSRLPKGVTEDQLTPAERIARAHGLPLSPLREAPAERSKPPYYTTKVIHVKRKRKNSKTTNELTWQGNVCYVE